MPRSGRLVWFLILIALAAVPAAGQSIMERLVTPGALASPHAKLESKCDSCHSSFRKEAQNGKCTSCHKAVGADIATRAGYHGKYGPARSAACKSCHSDHKGRGFALIKLNRANFDHTLTDYPLRGAHARVTCAQCHGKGNNYRGLATSCAACHKADDPHRGGLGAACQNCHTVDGWKALKPFDHSRTGFALGGAHRKANCLYCHTGQRWNGLPASCNSCHAKEDAHRGSRGTNCASCHTAASWNAVTFDHSSTGFALSGGHAGASCASCHGPGNANKHPGKTCVSCHAKDNVHPQALGTQCAQCHDARSWQRISFDHDKLTGFALKGAHRATTCQSCHKPRVELVKPAVTCISCHAADDKHEGRNGQDCQRCHGEKDWKAVDFNHDTMTRFSLKGAHARIQCEGCHTAPAQDLKLSTECASCHASDDVHQGALGPGCSRCHDVENWKSGVRFDHDLTRLPLLGKHSQLACTSCHSDQSYRSKGITCADCHIDDHHKGTLGAPSQCRDCHNAANWKAWSFDHDSQTRYPLTGMHKGLICSACHSRPGNPAEAGSQCVDCHKRNDVHRGGFGQDCERCHVTSSFREILLRQKQN